MGAMWPSTDGSAAGRCVHASHAAASWDGAEPSCHQGRQRARACEHYLFDLTRLLGRVNVFDGSTYPILQLKVKIKLLRRIESVNRTFFLLFTVL
jgi:hypothetical protein